METEKVDLSASFHSFMKQNILIHVVASIQNEYRVDCQWKDFHGFSSICNYVVIGLNQIQMIRLAIETINHVHFLREINSMKTCH